MPDKINIKKSTGEIEEADIVTFLEIDPFGRFAVVTLNETDANGLVKVYIAKIVETEEGGFDTRLILDNEWDAVKNKMRELVAGGVQ